MGKEKNDSLELVDIWNGWIGFCKKPMTYDMAFAFMLSLIGYLIASLGGYFIFDFNEPSSHTFGVLIMFLSFLAVAYTKGKKNGWLKKLFEDMDEEV